MPKTLTIEGIPDAVFEQLAASAALHRTSLGNEAIACLAAALLPRKIGVREAVAEARRLPASLAPRVFGSEDVDRAKRSGRA